MRATVTALWQDLFPRKFTISTPAHPEIFFLARLLSSRHHHLSPLWWRRSVEKKEMSQEELDKIEQEEFQTGPMSVLTKSVKDASQVLICCRNNKKL